MPVVKKGTKIYGWVVWHGFQGDEGMDAFCLSHPPDLTKQYQEDLDLSDCQTQPIEAGLFQEDDLYCEICLKKIEVPSAKEGKPKTKGK